MKTPAASHMLEGLESTFSFCLSLTLSLLLRGVSYSIDGVGDVVPAGTEVGEEESAARIGAPLFVIRTDLVLIADKGSSFLFLILAYISLLNFVVISTRREHLSIIVQVNTKRKKGNTVEPKTYFFFPSISISLSTYEEGSRPRQ